ncbi:hypothetical protein ACLMJK_004571 [Lecanora helva]
MSPVPMPVPAPWGAPAAGFHSHWPPANGLTTIHCPRNDSVFQVNASSHINAPVDIIWDVLRNTSGFPEWNTFTPSATITSQPLNKSLPAEEQDFLNLGTKFTYSVVLDSRAPQNRTPSMEQVDDVSTPVHQSNYVPSDLLKNDGSFFPDLSRVYRISWVTDPDSDIVKQGLCSERFNEIIPLDDCNGRKKGCEYRTWELQGGPPATYVQQLYGTLLQEDFEIWARDLKGKAEKKAKTQRGRGHHGH